MTERYGESGVESFEGELRLQALLPAGKDQRIAAFCKASIESLQESPRYRDLVGRLITDRDDLTPTNAVNLTLRGLQRQLMLKPRSGYPEVFEDQHAWKESIEFVCETPPAYEGFSYDVLNRNLQSNVSGRYKAVSLIATAMQSRLGKRPSILDVGCSRNHGLKRLTLGKKYPFRYHIAGRIIEDKLGNPLAANPDRRSTRKTREALDQGLRLNRSLGIDIEPLDDEGNRAWARSCSFYPSELLDTRLVKEYDDLDQIERKSIGFYQADFSRVTAEELEEEAPVSRFDMVTFSTVLYQASEEERTKMLKTATALLKPYGIILIQDFVDIDTDDPSRLVFYEHWHDEPYKYRTILLDPKVRGGNFIEQFRWDNGRCNTLLPPTDSKYTVAEELSSLKAYAELTGPAKHDEKTPKKPQKD